MHLASSGFLSAALNVLKLSWLDPGVHNASLELDYIKDSLSFGTMLPT